MTVHTNLTNQKRKFLKQLFTSSFASLTLPAWANAPNDLFPSREAITALATNDDPSEERYWEMVKKQFSIPDHLLMVNAANLCPSPYVVNEQVHTAHQRLEKDVSFQLRSGFATEREQALQLMADFVGVRKEEIGITRNTTESNNIIVNGLDLKKGDEVVLWEQNHPSNGTAWEQRAKRYGFTIKKVSLPANPTAAEELIEPFAKAIHSKTRLLSFSHISNTTGMALPAQALCQLAKEHNIFSLVDGAQSLGMMDLNLKEMGCDFYTGSTYKWLMGPLENGVLYVNKAHLGHVWPTIVGAGWKSESATVDEKLCLLGQRNETTLSALSAVLKFHHAIGKKQIEERILALNSYLKQQIREKIPAATFITPLSPTFSGGVTILQLPGKEAQILFQKLYDQYGIACAPTGGLRFSPHIYNTMADMDKVVDALIAITV